MAGSSVPLKKWFDAVLLLLWHPTIEIRELALEIQLTRLATVRSMCSGSVMRFSQKMRASSSRGLTGTTLGIANHLNQVILLRNNFVNRRAHLRLED